MNGAPHLTHIYNILLLKLGVKLLRYFDDFFIDMTKLVLILTHLSARIEWS